MEKYGLLYYKDTDNIGDDIQTYAASRFLPKIDYMIDRENLNAFVPNKKEYVKTIMNAWYIHDKYNFDISPYIFPLFTSMFFKSIPYEDGITLGTDYINSNVIELLKKYSPVGTRDNHTLKIMKKLGIDSYFSGCMTLTIDPFKNVKKKDIIVTVGLTKKEIEHIKKHTKKEVIEFIQDVPKFSFSNETWDQRKQRVIDTLKLYQSASMVITTKLHCSLPTLALGTPILLLYDKSKKENIDRIGTFISFVNHINRNDFFNYTNFDKPKRNPDKYLEIKNALVAKCNEFVNTPTPSANSLPNTDDYIYLTNRGNVQKKLILNNLYKLMKKYRNECSKSNELFIERNETNKKIIEILQKHENDLKAMNYENDKLKKEITDSNNKLKDAENELIKIRSSKKYKICFNNFYLFLLMLVYTLIIVILIIITIKFI